MRDKSLKNQFFRASTIFSSGFGAASLAFAALDAFATNAGYSTSASAITGLAALAGAGCAHAYFVGSDDRTDDYEKELEKDSITNILSRTGLERALPSLFKDTDTNRKSSRGAFLISMDFDELRDINEVYGAETGNAVLTVIAERLSKLVGDAGPLARTNGSEFVVGLKAGLNENELRAAVTALLDAMSKPVRIGAVAYPIYANGGVAEIRQPNQRLEKILRFANLARTNAKASGRGSYAIYHSEMSHQATYRQWLETELTYAMQRNEFDMCYQPQVDVENNEIVAYEALVRWNHRNKGAIAPEEFIAVAENCGFIQQLGTWILRRACFDALKLPEHTRISVNVSTVQLQEADFTNTLRTVLGETGLDPQRLELEVTESVLIRDHISMRSLFKSLREIGVSIAIDDFGTGYSNLTNLSELTFDKIKIDRSFIDRLNPHPSTTSMISTIINLAHSMEAEVVAEGVETEEQQIILKAAGCNIVQGYLHGRPHSIFEAISANEAVAA